MAVSTNTYIYTAYCNEHNYHHHVPQIIFIKFSEFSPNIGVSPQAYSSIKVGFRNGSWGCTRATTAANNSQAYVRNDGAAAYNHLPPSAPISIAVIAGFSHRFN